MIIHVTRSTRWKITFSVCIQKRAYFSYQLHEICKWRRISLQRKTNEICNVYL